MDHRGGPRPRTHRPILGELRPETRDDLENVWMGSQVSAWCPPDSGEDGGARESAKGPRPARRPRRHTARRLADGAQSPAPARVLTPSGASLARNRLRAVRALAQAVTRPRSRKVAEAPCPAALPTLPSCPERGRQAGPRACASTAERPCSCGPAEGAAPGRGARTRHHIRAQSGRWPGEGHTHRRLQGVVGAPAGAFAGGCPAHALTSRTGSGCTFPSSQSHLIY